MAIKFNNANKQQDIRVDGSSAWDATLRLARELAGGFAALSVLRAETKRARSDAEENVTSCSL